MIVVITFHFQYKVQTVGVNYVRVICQRQRKVISLERYEVMTLIPKPKGSGGARAATAQVGPANKRNDTKRRLPIEASLRPGEAVPW